MSTQMRMLSAEHRALDKFILDRLKDRLTLEFLSELKKKEMCIPYPKT